MLPRPRLIDPVQNMTPTAIQATPLINSGLAFFVYIRRANSASYLIAQHVKAERVDEEGIHLEFYLSHWTFALFNLPQEGVYETIQKGAYNP